MLPSYIPINHVRYSNKYKSVFLLKSQVMFIATLLHLDSQVLHLHQCTHQLQVLLLQMPLML
jgi:hypothetical protein